MNVVFLNATGDTFTPTGSGAIGTWIWELCSVARLEGVEPLVITRSSHIPPHSWPNTRFVHYPPLRPFRGAGRLFDLQKLVTGWGHKRQGIYAERVVAAIRGAGAGGPDTHFVLNNDIEMAVHLRRCFPEAFILHNAQNNNPCAGRYRRAFSRAVNVASAVSDYCASWNSNYFGMPVQTLLSGVDAGQFRPAEPRLGGEPVINFVGRTDRPKGPDILLEACMLLSKKTKAFSLQILGRNHYDRFQMDPFQKHLQDLSEGLERAGIRVRRPGWIGRAALPDELRKAHIHCVPARWDEPFGLTTLEGMACGLATVASRTGGTAQVAGGGALLFERESVEELAGHLHELVTNEYERIAQARKARERALQLPWSLTWHRLKSLLRLRETTENELAATGGLKQNG